MATQRTKLRATIAAVCLLGAAAPARAAVDDKPKTSAEATRFLQQATFGYSDADIAQVKAIGYSAWIDQQIALPLKFNHVNEINSYNKGIDVRAPVTNETMWLALVKDDQLRQRVMWALSQIMVVSNVDGSTQYWGRGLAQYVDNFYKYEFTTYRQLLESVTLNPAMGQFLSHIYNRKEDPNTGAMPDQNYAREVMQLFTIGLWQLNANGTLKKDANGQPIPTYTTADVVGVSKVLTGFAPKGALDWQWDYYYCFCQNAADRAGQIAPMAPNNRYHSTSVKSFLGTTIPAGSGDAAADLKVLLDRLSNHPNTGPFIGRQLIQRLVTSNPSPAYVARVAAKFANNGIGVRGDLKAVVKAVLLDPEARSAAGVTRPTFGRVREPVQRMAQIMRVFAARTVADKHSYHISARIYDQNKGLWQNPLGSRTVFNFYYPDYRPPNSEIGSRGLVAPELQITTAASVGDVDSIFFDYLENAGQTDCCSDAQRNTYFMKFDYSSWLPLVARPDELLDKMNARFMAGQMSADLRAAIKRAIADRTGDRSYTSGIVRGETQLKFAAGMRAMLASPEYVVQK